MSRNGSGVYSLPAGSTITNGDTSDAADLNTPLADIEADLNTPRPVVAGGTGASSASAALVNLGLTATAAEINVLDGVTASTAELNILDGVTATTTELNYVDGVTSAIQTQLNAKQASGATLTSLEGLSLAEGDILYATAADTLQRLAKGTAGQSLVMNTGATAPEWSSAGALNVAAWHPYDMVDPTDGAIGRFYNGATQATITTPTFADGYDYIIRWEALSMNTGGRDIDLDIGGLNIVLEAAALAADVISGTLQLNMPTLENSVRYVSYTRRIASGGQNFASAVIPTTFATAITSATFSLSSTGSFDAGQVFLYRRRNYISG